MATVQAIQARQTSSTWDFFYAADMALASLISYTVTTRVLSPIVAEPDALLGGFAEKRAPRGRLRSGPAARQRARQGRGLASGLASGKRLSHQDLRERSPARHARRTRPAPARGPDGPRAEFSRKAPPSVHPGV